MDPEMSFTMYKNIIIAQNKELLRQISIQYKNNVPSYDFLVDKYIRPEYYLPIIQKPIRRQNDKEETRTL